MIPHARPIRFPLFGGRVRLPEDHPLCVDGVYPTLGLIELAAQAAGGVVVRALAADALEAGIEARPHAGMLVEVESASCERPVVPAGEVLTLDVQETRVMGVLRRYTVHVHGALRVSLTLRIVPVDAENSS